MSIKGKFKITKKIFNNGDFYIFGASPVVPYSEDLKLNKYFSITIKGNGLSWITESKEYEFEIEELSTDNYGTSYKIISCSSFNCDNIENLSIDEAKEILNEITTESQTDNLLSAYPNFIWLALTKGRDAFDTDKIYNVGESRLNAYIRELNVKYKYLSVMNRFKEFKFDITDCKNLIERYETEDNISLELKENPYKVNIEILKRSFEYTDRMLMELRPDLKVSDMRCAYLILSVLEKNESEGSTRLNGNDLYYYVLNEYNVPELEPLIVPVAMNNDLFYYDEKSKDLSIMSTYLAECQLKDFIECKIANSNVLDIEWNKYTKFEDFEMSKKQGSALEMFCKYNIMVLAGFSGSGKTTSLKGLIKLMEDNSMTYTLLAPTGKASMRMSEATHRNASTIHRKVLKEEYITTDVIIVDECSMIDLPTFIMLINAIANDNCRIVFVGDPAQLMPVGVGCVFCDIIESGKLPMVMLDEVFRYNTDGGLFVATNIRQGREFFSNTDMVKQNGNEYSVCNNYKFINTDNIFETLVDEYMKLINKGIKPKDILCLSPFNVGNEGTYKINNTLQTEINPPLANEFNMQRTIGKTNITFRVGDKVLNKKNDYQALPLESYNEIQNSNGLLIADDVELTTVFNGQEGYIREIDEKKMVIQFDEEFIVFDKNKTNNLLLGNAISVHASQGSEAKYVINVISPTHKKMLNKNLLYVADTRGKTMTIDIGDISTFNNALLVDGNAERSTWLKELLVS